MVSTRSKKTNYSVDFPDVPRPVRSNQDPISKYYAHLEGVEKSILLTQKSKPVHQRALDFNWFLKRVVPLKKNGEEASFDDLFSQVKQRYYPTRIRRRLRKDYRRKWEALTSFKGDMRLFYDEIYGPNRFFDVITDEVLGHKVIVHENLYRMYGNKRTGRSPFYAVSESLVGSLFACQQDDLLTSLNHNSVYEYNKTKYLLVGPLYFVPHNCDSMICFDNPRQDLRMSSDVRTVKLFSEDPHHSTFKVGDEVAVNYHMGEHASQYNFVCACGSPNCVSLNK
jgi:hypothetical protein